MAGTMFYAGKGGCSSRDMNIDAAECYQSKTPCATIERFGAHLDGSATINE